MRRALAPRMRACESNSKLGHRTTESNYCAGKCGVMVGIVRTPDHPVVTDEWQERRQCGLVDLKADGALAGKVFAGSHRHLRAKATECLGLFVESFEPEGHPATTRF